ncbi:hypothetical protein THRCLA_06279 [Thraustotheca clavata]|uniref:Putative auto-transporter adhesin head GIN domain-containing protein n=1 Tax=Thraustotheca clavata TaxID=74557 RepID=A0A1V9ZPU5_9STRA|nr:hypothetical protein THRCLA_06279 [Thraustotheca clavata]
MPNNSTKTDKSTATREITFDEKNINALREGVSGSKVFISTHGDNSTKVVLTGQQADIDRVKAQVHLYKLGGRILELNLDDDPNPTSLEGRVLMEILIDETQPLQVVESVGSSDIVLENGAIGSQAIVEKIGNGSMYLNFTKDVDMKKLHAVLRGSGLIQLVAPNVKFHSSLQLDAVGSGSIRLHTKQMMALSLASKVTGSGDILVNATNLDTNQLSSMVTGSGAIRYHQAGVIGNHVIDLCGSGKVVSSSLLSEKVLASITGSGEILTQALKALDGTVFGSGTFKVCEPWPEHLHVSPRYEKITHSSKTFKPHPVPTRDLKFGFQKQINLFGDTISINVDI